MAWNAEAVIHRRCYQALKVEILSTSTIVSFQMSDSLKRSKASFATSFVVQRSSVADLVVAFSNALFCRDLLLASVGRIDLGGNVVEGSRGQESFGLVYQLTPLCCFQYLSLYADTYEQVTVTGIVRIRLLLLQCCATIIIRVIHLGLSSQSHLTKQYMFTPHTSPSTTLNQQSIQMNWATFNT